MHSTMYLALRTARVRVAEVDLRVALVVLAHARESLGALARVRRHGVDGPEQHRRGRHEPGRVGKLEHDEASLEVGARFLGAEVVRERQDLGGWKRKKKKKRTRI